MPGRAERLRRNRPPRPPGRPAPRSNLPSRRRPAVPRRFEVPARPALRGVRWGRLVLLGGLPAPTCSAIGVGVGGASEARGGGKFRRRGGVGPGLRRPEGRGGQSHPLGAMGAYGCLAPSSPGTPSWPESVSALGVQTGATAAGRRERPASAGLVCSRGSRRTGKAGSSAAGAACAGAGARTAFGSARGRDACGKARGLPWGQRQGPSGRRAPGRMLPRPA